MNFGVTNPKSTEHQVQHALKLLEQTASDEKIFMFLNVSAIHGPNRYFVEGAKEDSVETQRAALRYVDEALGPLFEAMRKRARPAYCLAFSDHGTAYGEDGYQGHRLAHDVVWTVPYREFLV